jgi:4-amino-4-deoxy-L-arabinose transferase-like glycosyltransferase
MSRRTWLATLVAIVALAAFLRLWRLRELPPGLYADEAMDGNNAVEALENHRFQVFYPEDNGREGMYINLAALSIACFGNQAWALRLPSALFGVLTVAGLAFLGAELFDGPVGLLAAFFLATSFWHMLLSREAFRAIAAPCFLTWALYLLLAARRRTDRPPAESFAAGTMALAGVIYGLGFYTYIAYRATPLLVALLLRRANWKRAALFTASAAVVAAPLAAYFATHPGTFAGRTAQLSVSDGRPAAQAAVQVVLNTWRTARMFFVHGDYNWRHNYPWRAELFWPVAGFLLLGLIRRREGKAVVLAWLAVAALPVVLSREDVPHALRSILLLPPVMLLAALGAQGLWGYVLKRVPAPAVAACAALLLAGLAYEPYHTYFDRWALNPQMPQAFDIGAAGVARKIQSLPRDEEKYVVTPPGADMLPQPVMFLTGSYTPRQQAAAHIHYLAEPDCARARERFPGAHVFCLAPGLPTSGVAAGVKLR